MKNNRETLCGILHRVTIGLLSLLFLTSCSVVQEQPRSTSHSAESEGGSVTEYSSSVGKEVTSEDYDNMRMEIIQNRDKVTKEEMIQSLPYMSDKLGTAFLSSDNTITVLESYLNHTIFLTPENIESLLYYNAATHNLITWVSRKHLPEKYAGYNLPSAFYLKEDIDFMAKLLFGEDTVIDYSYVELLQGQYLYNGLSKTASFERLVTSGDNCVVIDYIDLGDYFDVTVAFLYWSTQLGDKYGAWLDGELVTLDKDEAVDYCINKLPRYTVRVDKGDDGLLYFASIDKME